MNDPGVNVVTIQDLDYDKLLGPLPMVAHVMDTMVMIGLRCSEVRSIVQQLKVAPKKNEMTLEQQTAGLSGSRHFHWLFYVQTARNEAEQNLEVVTKHSQLYYRTTRDIKVGEELLVWYSKELVDAFQVPEVAEFYDKDERRYFCHYCHEPFLYPNPLKVHLMYRCHRRLAEVHGLNTVNKVQLDSINRLQLDLYSATMLQQPVKPTTSANNLSANNKLNSASFTFSSLANNFLDMYRRVTPMAAVAAAAAAAANNLGVEKENNTALSTQHNLASTNSSILPLFQSTDYGLVISNDSQRGLKRSLDQTPPTSGSAFKKVNKSVSATNTYANDASKQPLYPITTYSLPLAPTASPPAASVANLSSPSTPVSCWGGVSVTTSASQERQTTPTPPPASTFSILNSVTSPYVTVSPRPNINFNSHVTANDDTSAMLTVSYRNAVYTDSMYHLSVNLHGSNKASALSPPLQAPTTTQPQQQQQPLTSILPPSLAALAFPSQNWCAKCNATFRMTSDLVYHMRSHHKRDPDPMKKKREDKLRCHICNETFRERHHLTRHMTSHN